MAGETAVSTPPATSRSLPRSTKDSMVHSSGVRRVSFTNPTEMWEMVTKQIDAEKLKTLRTFGQDTLTKGGEVANKLTEKANSVTQWLMSMARAHPYAFTMSLVLSGVASVFVGSFLLLVGVWVMILAGVLASFCMVGLAVFAVVLMTTWSILFTLVCAGTALYLPYVLYMCLEAGWFARSIEAIKATITQIIDEAKKVSKQAVDTVMGEGRKRLQ